MSCGGFFLVLSTCTAFSLRNQEECLSIPVWKSKFYGAFVLNHMHPTHWLISTQIDTISVSVTPGDTVLILIPFAARGSMRPCCIEFNAPLDIE